MQATKDAVFYREPKRFRREKFGSKLEEILELRITDFYDHMVFRYSSRVHR